MNQAQITGALLKTKESLFSELNLIIGTGSLSSIEDHILWLDLADANKLEMGGGLKSLADANIVVVRGLSDDCSSRAEQAQIRHYFFNAGFVSAGCYAQCAGAGQMTYIRSELIAEPWSFRPSGVHGASMSSLGTNGRFGNQLWQYLFLRMYGHRNALNVKVPPWEGEQVFCFSDARPSDSDRFNVLNFDNAGDEDLELWDIDDAPEDIDFRGYFQNVPEQWRMHRSFIRRMFSLRRDWQDAIDGLLSPLRQECRTLVAIHVRRGDYRTYRDGHPLFRMAPVEWYKKHLLDVWPRLSRPLLHVATDEPADVRSHFDCFETLDLSECSTIPAHVLDFSLLREADYLLACNSSFSTSASLLAGNAQKCFLVDYTNNCFVPYDPWIDGPFIQRYLPKSRFLNGEKYGLKGARRQALALRAELGRIPWTEANLERAKGRVRYLEGGDGSASKKYIFRVIRAMLRR